MLVLKTVLTSLERLPKSFWDEKSELFDAYCSFRYRALVYIRKNDPAWRLHPLPELGQKSSLES